MNNLEQLLLKPTYFVLGAGSSKAYGFPLWEELKNSIMSLLKESIENSSDVDRVRVCERWRELIVANDQKPDGEIKTIDHVIENNSKNRVQRQIVLNMMKEVLVSCERADAKSSSTGWVEKLVILYKAAIDSRKQIDDSSVLDVLENTNVVTLNYERCFEEHFLKPLYRFICYSEFDDSDFIMTHKPALTKFFSTFHPHGAVGAGSLEKIEGGTIDRVQCISKVKSGGHKSNVGAMVPYGKLGFDVNLDLVGDDPLDDNYADIHNSIPSDANCVVMGLSGIGLDGCRLSWDSFQRIVYFGSDKFEFGGMRVDRVLNTDSEVKPDDQMVDWLGSPVDVDA